FDLAVGRDRALMRTATRPWFAHGPATWSLDGTRIALFDADSIRDGESRLVVVPAEGGIGETIGWVAGILGRASWVPSENEFVFDTTPKACYTNEGARSTFIINWGSGSVSEAT